MRVAFSLIDITKIVCNANAAQRVGAYSHHTLELFCVFPMRAVIPQGGGEPSPRRGNILPRTDDRVHSPKCEKSSQRRTRELAQAGSMPMADNITTAFILHNEATPSSSHSVYCIRMGKANAAYDRFAEIKHKKTRREYSSRTTMRWDGFGEVHSVANTVLHPQMRLASAGATSEFRQKKPDSVNGIVFSSHALSIFLSCKLVCLRERVFMTASEAQSSVHYPYTTSDHVVVTTCQSVTSCRTLVAHDPLASFILTTSLYVANNSRWLPRMQRKIRQSTR